MGTALVVIDVQNDYFPGGRYPLWNTDATLDIIEQAIARAQGAGIPVILVQHVAKGAAPFFTRGTDGVELHPRIRAAAPDAPVVVKEYADSFLETPLEQTLTDLGVTELIICGMMTQNCVTHTAISRRTEKYRVSILADGCTTVDEMIHRIALAGIAPRVPLVTLQEAFQPPAGSP